MPQTIHIVRHAQGFHQLPLSAPNTSIRDAELTPHGKSQCASFRRDTFPIAHFDSIDLLCASPFRRTIQTAQLAFEPCLKRGMRIVCLPDAQEATAAPSDTGSSVEELRARFGEREVDYSNMEPLWYEKTGRNAVSIEALRARARALRKWLGGREEREIVLVTHGLFAHYLTGDIDEEGGQLGE
jgi:broad specificity phosphatase PhoE